MSDSEVFVLLVMASWAAGAASNILYSYLLARREQNRFKYSGRIFFWYPDPERIDRTSIFLSILYALVIPAGLVAVRLFGVVTEQTAIFIGYFLVAVLTFSALVNGFWLGLGLLMIYMKKS